jgi:hypothetical protein
VAVKGHASVELSIDSAHPVSPKNLHSLKVQVTRLPAGRVSGEW